MPHAKARDRRYVDALLQLQRGTIEIVVIAIVLGLGINLASSGFPQLMNLSAGASTVAGAALIVFCLLYLGMKTRPALLRTLKFNGVLPINSAGEVVEISRYEFSEEMHSYIRALLAENKAMEKTWQRARFGIFGEEDFATQTRSREEGNRLIREALEYFALSKLSLHLSEYFVSDRNIESETVAKIQRRNIPQLLLDNRFLELFSKPMKERAAFQREDHGDDDDDERVVFATGEDGELFDQFELILPLGTTLSRLDENTLCIRTDRFTLKLIPIFERMSTNFPRDFEDMYLGMKFMDVHAHSVKLRIEVSFARWAIATRRGWDYYEWLDSFLEELERAFVFDDFIDHIGWHTAHTVALTARNDRASASTNAG